MLDTFFTPVVHEHPIVIIPERVLAAMAAETERYMAPETGESQVGIIIEPAENDPFREPIFIILGTIPAGSAIRQSALFELGGDFQVKVFDWLQQNWDAIREQSRTRQGYEAFQWGDRVPQGFVPKMFDLPLSDVGDWHKHPTGYTHPSPGDEDTAVETLLDPEFNTRYLIAPIVTVSQRPGTRFGWQGDLVSHQRTPFQMEISFSYMSRRMVQQGLRNFLTIKPRIVPNEYVPELPVLAWDLIDPNRARMEQRLLEDYGCVVHSFYRETRGGPPLEVCFEVSRPVAERPWDYRLFIETMVGYPAKAPAVRIIKDTNAPGNGASTLAQESAQQTSPKFLGWLRRKVEETPLLRLPQLQQQTTPGKFTWDSSCTLLSLILHLEKGGKVWLPQISGTAPNDTSAK